MPPIKGEGSTRPPAVAGVFYPGVADELRRLVAGLLAGACCEPREGAAAIIAPHAGYVYSGPVAAEAFASVARRVGQVRRLVVVGPAHHVAFGGVAAPSVRAFATPLGDMAVDADAVRALADRSLVAIDDKPHGREHALEVELPFLQVVFGDLPIIPLLVGAARMDDVAEALLRLWDDETLIVASTDLSHHHPYEAARRRDARTAAAVERLDAAAIGPGDACGRLAVGGLLMAAARRGLKARRLDLRNSGDAGGGRDHVVGYGAWAVSSSGVGTPQAP